MRRQWLELKMTLRYLVLTIITTVLIIWLEKEWYWHWAIEMMGLRGLPIMVTSLIEEYLTYLGLSWWLGLIISQLSVILLIRQYLIKGLYHQEDNVLKKWSLNLLVVNLIIPPIIGKALGYWLITAKDNEIILIGKMSQYLDFMQIVLVLGQLVWIIPLIFSLDNIRKIYTNYRKLSMYFITLIIGVITPPDFWFVMIVVGFIFGLIEIGIFLKGWSSASV